MKKTIIFNLAFILLIPSNILNLKAQNNFDSSSHNQTTTTTILELDEYGYSNAKISYNSEKNTPLRSDLTPDMTLDLYIDSTNEEIHFERIDMTGFFFVNGNLETTVEYGVNSKLRATIPSSIKNLGFSAKSGFSIYYYSGSEDWIAKQIKGMVKDKAIALIMSAMTGSLPVYITGIINSAYKFSSDLYNLATLANTFSDNSLRAVTVFYASYNSQCNILAYYGANVYLLKEAWKSDIDENSGQVFTPNKSHTWNGNPWDYTQPSACRSVVNSYPY